MSSGSQKLFFLQSGTGRSSVISHLARRQKPIPASFKGQEMNLSQCVGCDLCLLLSCTITLFLWPRLLGTSCSAGQCRESALQGAVERRRE